jgi:hypothetical protein
MVLILMCIAIGVWALYMGAKFYGRMDWDEPAESSPDFGQMQKREAQLTHIQDVLQEAQEEGKLSKGFLEEYARFVEKEIAAIEAAKKAWSQRPRGPRQN